MHSKDRLARYEGNSGIKFKPGTLNQTIIEALYGRYREIDGKSKQEWLLNVQQGGFLIKHGLTILDVYLHKNK